jgi:hypothetical protein
MKLQPASSTSALAEASSCMKWNSPYDSLGPHRSSQRACGRETCPSPGETGMKAPAGHVCPNLKQSLACSKVFTQRSHGLSQYSSPMNSPPLVAQGMNALTPPLVTWFHTCSPQNRCPALRTFSTHHVGKPIGEPEGTRLAGGQRVLEELPAQLYL